MFAKVLIFALAVGASYGQEHHYALKSIVRHEQPKEYIHQVPEHSAPEEPAPIYETQYQTDSHEQAVSSQAVHHEPSDLDIQLSSGKQSVPFYHYLQQEEHKPVHFHHGISLQSLYKHDTPTIHKHQSHHEPSHYESHYSHEDLSHHAPQHHVSHHESHSEDSHEKPIDYYAHPKYQYEYKVEDPHTGDNKYQQEVRDGDVVKGVYSFHEADGSIRTVEYTSDKHKGFNAVVKHTPPRQHGQEHHHQN